MEDNVGKQPTSTSGLHMHAHTYACSPTHTTDTHTHTHKITLPFGEIQSNSPLVPFSVDSDCHPGPEATPKSWNRLFGSF